MVSLLNALFGDANSVPMVTMAAIVDAILEVMLIIFLVK